MLYECEWTRLPVEWLCLFHEPFGDQNPIRLMLHHRMVVHPSGGQSALAVAFGGDRGDDAFAMHLGQSQEGVVMKGYNTPVETLVICHRCISKGAVDVKPLPGLHTEVSCDIACDFCHGVVPSREASVVAPSVVYQHFETLLGRNQRALLEVMTLAQAQGKEMEILRAKACGVDLVRVGPKPGYWNTPVGCLWVCHACMTGGEVKTIGGGGRIRCDFCGEVVDRWSADLRSGKSVATFLRRKQAIVEHPSATKRELARSADRNERLMRSDLALAMLQDMVPQAEEEAKPPFGMTWEECAKTEQGQPDGETWAYIVEAWSSKERLDKLKKLIELLS